MTKVLYKHLVENRDTSVARGKGAPLRKGSTGFTDWTPVEPLGSSSGISDGTYNQIAISGSGSAFTIVNSSVTNAQLDNMAANTVKTNPTASAAAPQDTALAASQLLGRGSTGNIAPIVLGTNLSMSGTTLNATGGGTSHAQDTSTVAGVTHTSDRDGGTATVLTNPAAGEYTLTVQSGAYLKASTVFGDNTTLNGSNEMILRIDNSANTENRRFIVQLYDANNNALVDQQLTATVHTQAVAGNITTLTIPGLNGFGATGYYIEIR